MALFLYFKKEKDYLPDPHDPLAQAVPSTSIAAANSVVHSVIYITSQNSKKRGHLIWEVHYLYTPVIAAVCHYNQRLTMKI